jgi:hypothetical protein
LEYKCFSERNDSIEIFFIHNLPTGLKDSIDPSDNHHLPSVAFNRKTRQKLWAWDINGFSNGLYPGDERVESPASPKVIAFIKTHRSILNPCFLELAKKANILLE